MASDFAKGQLRRQSIREHDRKDFHHLPVAAVGAGKPSPDPLQSAGQNPVLKWCAVALRPRLAGKNRTLVPRVRRSSWRTQRGCMVSDHEPVLADDEPIGVDGFRRGTLRRPRSALLAGLASPHDHRHGRSRLSCQDRRRPPTIGPRQCERKESGERLSRPDRITRPDPAPEIHTLLARLLLPPCRARLLVSPATKTIKPMPPRRTCRSRFNHRAMETRSWILEEPGAIIIQLLKCSKFDA